MEIHDFAKGSETQSVQFFAEVKPFSPSEGSRDESWEQLAEIAIEHGDGVSIHTHPLFKGSVNRIRQAARMTTKPILAKGFHFNDNDILRMLDAGASYVLVVGRIPGVELERCFIEPITSEELAFIPREAAMAVWNARDLVGMLQKVGAKDILADLARVHPGRLQLIDPRPSFDEVRAMIGGNLCQASHLKTVSDIRPGANAILVGSHLAKFIASM